MPEIIPIQASPHRRYGSNSGQPLTRRDGVLKVTGRAMYAADNHPEGMLYAVYAVSTIARGRVTHLDVNAAKAHPGVVEVITPANRPPLMHDPEEKLGLFGFRIEVLQNDRVRYANQPIALVVAETLEAATEGAALLEPRYEVEPARTGLDVERFVPPSVGIGGPTSVVHGDVEAGLAKAARRIEASYETPPQYHNAMEPHAIVATWDGDRLTLDMPNQAPVMAGAAFASYFGIPPENVLIRTPFIGGGFGSKAILAGPQILCILAARMLKRPVKLVLTRSQMFGPVGHRGQTRQRLRLGMEADGRLTALAHHAIAATSSFDDFLEPAAAVSRLVYASPAIATAHEAVRNDIGTPGPMRAPGEASGSAALEAAIDEAADACGMDPLDFRLKNYAEVEPITGKPYSSKALRECYAEGAKRFGWSGRPLGSAADARRGRHAGRLGHGHRGLPLPDVRGRSARGAAQRWDGAGRDQRDRHGAGRSDLARPDRRRRAGARHRPDRIPRRQLRPARRRRRRRLGPYCDRRHGASIRPAATPSPGSPISPPPIRARRSSARAMPG